VTLRTSAVNISDAYPPPLLRTGFVVVVESAGIYDAITRRTTRLQIQIQINMSRDTTEHDPLLRTTILADDSRTEGKIEKTRIGPLELSPSTQYGILAGIWTATLVSASGSAYYIIVLALIVFVTIVTIAHLSTTLEFDIVPMSTMTLLVFQGLDFFIYFDILIRVKPRQ